MSFRLRQQIPFIYDLIRVYITSWSYKRGVRRAVFDVINKSVRARTLDQQILSAYQGKVAMRADNFSNSDTCPFFFNQSNVSAKLDTKFPYVNIDSGVTDKGLLRKRLQLPMAKRFLLHRVSAFFH